MDIHTAASCYIGFLIILALAMAKAGDEIRPNKLYVERCAISIYHGGNRVIYVGKGEVWR